MWKQAQAMAAARHLYRWAYQRGRRAKIKAWLTRRPRRLYPMETIHQSCVTGRRRRVGIQMVPLRQIRGSDSRVRDFDIDFYPLQAHDEERWAGVAAALNTGHRLPPVKLIQVENTYFVQDGHHRISIARAQGRQTIEAEVTHLEVGERLPGVDRPPHARCENGC